jgi:hypothetical protein
MDAIIHYVQKERKLKICNVTPHMNVKTWEKYTAKACEETSFVLYFFRNEQTEPLFIRVGTDRSNVFFMYKEAHLTLEIDTARTQPLVATESKSPPPAWKKQLEQILVPEFEPECFRCHAIELEGRVCRGCGCVLCAPCQRALKKEAGGGTSYNCPEPACQSSNL